MVGRCRCHSGGECLGRNGESALWQIVERYAGELPLTGHAGGDGTTPTKFLTGDFYVTITVSGPGGTDETNAGPLFSSCTKD